MKKTLISVVIALIIILAGDIIWQKYFRPAPKQISNFAECAALGNPVAESYPRQCRAGGQTFVEEVNIPEERAGQAIQKLLAEKYPKYARTIAVRIDKETAGYVRGGVIFEPGAPVGIFLAAKMDGQWQIVFDGNGEIPCGLLNYGFPGDMLADCI